MFHRVFRSLAVLLACVALCGAYHRHSYPIVMFNGCAAFPWSPLGVDGSVLLRSYVEPGPALRLFCRAHDLNKSTCEHVKESVVAEMKLHEQEELNWIGVWDQGRVQLHDAFPLDLVTPSGNIMLMFAAPHAPVLRRCVESFCAGASLVPENCVQIHAFGERVMGFARLREDEYAAAANRSNPGSAVQTPTTISAAPFNITTILTISAHDLEFLKPSLAQLSVVSGDIVLVAGDLLHDSITPENLSAIRAEVANYPQVTLVVYRNGGGEHTIALGGYEVPARRFWMKYARWAGVHYVNTRDGTVNPSSWILLLDADEVVDGRRLHEAITQTNILAEKDVIELSCYTYGGSPADQNLEWGHAGVLMRRSELRTIHLFTSDDRYFYKQGTVQSPYWRQQLMWTHPVDGEPMVHHYSFARATQENLKRKVFSSGHFDDGNTKWDHLRLSGRSLFENTLNLERVDVGAVLSNESFEIGVAGNTLRRRVVPFVSF